MLCTCQARGRVLVTLATGTLTVARVRLNGRRDILALAPTGEARPLARDLDVYARNITK